MKKKLLFVIGVLLLITSYSYLLFVSPEKATFLTLEDGPVEVIAPICWFLGAFVLFYLYFKSKSAKGTYLFRARRNIFYLFMALFFVFCGGEEISWGQRIFNMQTPEILKEDNAQDEINLHNLWVFSSFDKENHDKTGISKWLTSATVFAAIWFVYCILIPIFNETSGKSRNYFKKIYLPVLPFWIGLLFLMNYIISKAYENVGSIKNISNDDPINETKESVFALLFLIGSIVLYQTFKHPSKKNSQKKNSLLVYLKRLISSSSSFKKTG